MSESIYHSTRSFFSSDEIFSVMVVVVEMMMMAELMTIIMIMIIMMMVNETINTSQSAGYMWFFQLLSNNQSHGELGSAHICYQLALKRCTMGQKA